MGTDVVALASQLIDAARVYAAARYGPTFRLCRVTVRAEGPNGELVQVPLDPAAVSLEPTRPLARHSPDFRSVYWFGTAYGPFTPTQAAIISILWEAWENGTPDVGGDYLMERAGSDRSDQRVASVFGVTPDGIRAWNGLIVSRSKGSYRLAVPGQGVSADTPEEAG